MTETDETTGTSREKRARNYVERAAALLDKAAGELLLDLQGAAGRRVAALAEQVGEEAKTIAVGED